MTDPATTTDTLDAAGQPRRPVRGFVERNRDDLILEVIGGVILALVVSLLVFALDQSSADRRDAQSEALGNSLFVRQAVMAERAVLPFSSLNLRGAQLSGLPLAGADFSDADLTDAEIKRTDLTGANLSETDLTNVDLTETLLIDADLSEAQMDNTELSGTDFTGADVTEVDFTGAFYVDGEPPIGLDAIDELNVVEDSDSDDD